MEKNEVLGRTLNIVDIVCNIHMTFLFCGAIFCPFSHICTPPLQTRDIFFFFRKHEYFRMLPRRLFSSVVPEGTRMGDGCG